MTHQMGLLWTIAIYGLNITCLTKMAKDIHKQGNLKLGLCPSSYLTCLILPPSFLSLCFYFTVLSVFFLHGPD